MLEYQIIISILLEYNSGYIASVHGTKACIFVTNKIFVSLNLCVGLKYKSVSGKDIYCVLGFLWHTVSIYVMMPVWSGHSIYYCNRNNKWYMVA